MAPAAVRRLAYCGVPGQVGFVAAFLRLCYVSPVFQTLEEKLMLFPVRAALHATITATLLLSAPVAWSANMWFIQDTAGTMTPEDREMYKRTLDEQLDSGTVGQTKEWKNPASGNFGSVKVVKDFTRQEKSCRRVETFAQTKQIKNRARWNFCKQPAGEWKVDTTK